MFVSQEMRLREVVEVECIHPGFIFSLIALLKACEVVSFYQILNGIARLILPLDGIKFFLSVVFLVSWGAGIINVFFL